MIKKCVQIFMKDLNFKHFVDDNQPIFDFINKFITEIEKLRKKGGYLLLNNDPGCAAIRPSEINAIYISEEKGEILPKEEKSV
jgi:hypothetical protein